MEYYPTTSVAVLAARAVTPTGVDVQRQGMDLTNAALGISGAFRVTDDVVPGLPAWSPPA